MAFRVMYATWMIITIWSTVVKLVLAQFSLLDFLFYLFVLMQVSVGILFFRYRKSEKAKKLVIFTIIVFWALTGWHQIFNFIYNNYQYIQGHQVFNDAPMTIVVIYINSMITLVPPIVLTIMLIVKKLKKK